MAFKVCVQFAMNLIKYQSIVYGHRYVKVEKLTEATDSTALVSGIMIFKLIICGLVYLLHSIYTNDIAPRKDYGEFKLQMTDFNICKGPKRIDCNNITTRIENSTILVLDINIKKDVIPNRGKIVAMINDKPLIRLQMKKPCDHLFMKPLFQTIFNVTQNCLFKKGIYHINIDIEDVAKKYYGGMFLYGNLTFKSIFYNDDCNFSCGVIQVNFSPKYNDTHH